MLDNRILETLVEQNEILKKQLREQQVINQQMFQLIQQMNIALKLSNTVNYEQTEQRDDVESLSAVIK